MRAFGAPRQPTGAILTGTWANAGPHCLGVRSYRAGFISYAGRVTRANQRFYCRLMFADLTSIACVAAPQLMSVATADGVLAASPVRSACGPPPEFVRAEGFQDFSNHNAFDILLICWWLPGE